MSTPVKSERGPPKAETAVRVKEQKLSISDDEKDTTEIPIVDTTRTEKRQQEGTAKRKHSTASGGENNSSISEQPDANVEVSAPKKSKAVNQEEEGLHQEKVVHLSALQLQEVQRSLASLRKKRYDQKYRREWENTFNWVSPSKKSELCFYCKICQRDYFGGSTELMRHEVTRKHENNDRKEEIRRVQNASVVTKKKCHNNFPTVDLTDEPDTLPSTSQQIIEPPFFKRDAAKKRKRSEVKMEVKAQPTKRRSSCASGFEIRPPSKLKHPVVLTTEKVLMPYNSARLKKMQAVTPFNSVEGDRSCDSVPLAQRKLMGLDDSASHEDSAPSPTQITVDFDETPPKEEYILGPSAEKYIHSRGSEENMELMTIIEKKFGSSLVSDPFDVFGKHIANKLRTLTPEQNRFAQKLVMDVLFEGEMENLDRNTKVVKCGVSCVCN